MISLVDNAGLDFETQTTYDINVEYTDGLHTVTQTVTVTITDVNEAPSFTTTYYEDTYTDQIVSTVAMLFLGYNISHIIFILFRIKYFLTNAIV